MGKRRIALAVVWWGFMVSVASGQADFQRATLKGLPGVWPIVEKLNPDIQQSGLTWGDLQTGAETRLQRAGIRVLTADECWQMPGMPWLYITVGLLEALDGTYAVTIQASLYQEVQLTRPPKPKTFGITWETALHMGIVGPEKLVSIKKHMGSVLDTFVKAYQAANAE